ncbi:MAG: hypothetical protein DBY11_01175, partial [Eggerthellales bacterium]
MRINKPIVNYKDWKTKVIIGYVLIIALFCVATTWILFVTVPQAMEEMNRSESSVASQVEKDATANAESALQGEDAEQLSASANSVVGGGTYTVQAEDMARDQGNSLASIQVFGFGLLLAVLLIAALLSYWSYSAALNSVERTERALASFMANSSHEMKTPVASIKLLSESIVIAANRGQVDYVKEFAHRIEQASGHLEKLVHDMLSITRTTAPLKVKTIEKESLLGGARCNVLSVLQEALSVQESIAENKGLLLQTSFAKNIENVTVGLSELDFLTIVNNLVGNAIAYTDKGSVTVEAKYAKDSFTLRVSDTGCGISRSEQDRVFERFYRVESTRAAYAQGTG